jgi:hypothetical protein
MRRVFSIFALRKRSNMSRNGDIFVSLHVVLP